jgi:hypothetical protein
LRPVLSDVWTGVVRSASAMIDPTSQRLARLSSPGSSAVG